MHIAGFIKQSLVDYPGEIAAVLFLRGCNFRCPFCQNYHLLTRPGIVPGETVPEEEVMAFLQARQGFLDGVVISGGEPTLHAELPGLLARIKEMGYLVKLDSNGSNPVLLEELINRGLVDYVAMDIKAPLDYRKYQAACGKLSPETFFKVISSVRLLRQAPIRVEFRTTVVPTLHQPEDIEAIARSIAGAELYTLQQFNPEFTLDPALGQQSPYSKQEMQALAELARSQLQSVRVVNI